jgi:hypothetical protein
MDRLTGIRDTNLLILNKMDDRSLLSYCQTNKYAENLCNNEDFWRNRFIKVYGIEDAKLKDKNRSWKNYYLLVLYYKSKYTDKKALVKIAEKGYTDLFTLFSKNMTKLTIELATVLSGNRNLIYKLKASDEYLFDVGLLVAGRKGDKELIDFYLSKKESNLNMILAGTLEGNHIELFREYNKITPISAKNGLMYAAYGGNYSMVDEFICHGANNFNEGLEYAARSDQKGMIDYIIEKGANRWQDALDGAAEGGHIGIINFFLSKGAKITSMTKIRAEIGGNKDTIAYIDNLN